MEREKEVVYIRQGNPAQTLIMALMLLLGGVVVYMGVVGTPQLPAAQITQPTAAAQVAPPTPVVIYQPAPVVYTQQEQAPPQIALEQPAPIPTSAPSAPVQVEAQPMIIVIHERPAQNIVTGSGACAVGGSVARRCGK